MTPEEQGRHCAVCSKTVKDYTQMKTPDIIESLKKSEGEVCGRINVAQVTPISKKQKIYFLINGWLYRKAIYPMMALMGFGMINKKVNSQINHQDYPLKGKVAYQDYYTNQHKITLVVKNKSGAVISDANVRILNSKANSNKSYKTDKAGQLTIELKANDLAGDYMQLEILASGYNYKTMDIRLTKAIQRVEVKMEDEIFIMGEMAYVEPDTEPVTNEINDEVIEVTKCNFELIKNLPSIPVEISQIESLESVESNVGSTDTNPFIEKSDFTIFPVPSNDQVTILTNSTAQFNLEVFDSNGKKIHNLVNGFSRYTLDVNNYAAGVYYVLITMDGKVVDTQKMIVTK